MSAFTTSPGHMRRSVRMGWPNNGLSDYQLQIGGQLLHAVFGLVDIPTLELNETVGRLRQPESS